MRSVLNTKKEIRKLLVRGSVLFATLATVFLGGMFAKKTRERLSALPKPTSPLSYEVIPFSGSVAGKFAVAQGFNASPDAVIEEDDVVSAYQWGKEGVSKRTLTVSFKDKRILFRASPDLSASPTSSRVAELKYAIRYAWDFLPEEYLWDNRLEIKPKVSLFFKEENGVESAVAHFEDANLFRVSFRAWLGESPYHYPVLSPQFSPYLAVVDVFGPTGEIVSAEIYPLRLREETAPMASLPKAEARVNTSRPLGGFLPSETVVYLQDGQYLRLWQAEEATSKQRFIPYYSGIK